MLFIMLDKMAVTFVLIFFAEPKNATIHCKGPQQSFSLVPFVAFFHNIFTEGDAYS